MIVCWSATELLLPVMMVSYLYRGSNIRVTPLLDEIVKIATNIQHAHVTLIALKDATTATTRSAFVM